MGIPIFYIIVLCGFCWGMEVHWRPEFSEANGSDYRKIQSKYGGSEEVVCQTRVMKKNEPNSRLQWSRCNRVKNFTKIRPFKEPILDAFGWVLMKTELTFRAPNEKMKEKEILTCNFISPQFNSSANFTIIKRKDDDLIQTLRGRVFVKDNQHAVDPQWVIQVRFLYLHDIKWRKLVANLSYADLSKFPEKYSVSSVDGGVRVTIKNADFEDQGRFFVVLKATNGELFTVPLEYWIGNRGSGKRDYVTLNKKRYHPEDTVRAVFQQTHEEFQWWFKESSFHYGPASNTTYMHLTSSNDTVMETFLDGNDTFDQISWRPRTSGWLARLEKSSSASFDVLNGLEYVCITEMNSSLLLEGRQRVSSGEDVALICKADGCDFVGDEVINWYHKSPDGKRSVSADSNTSLEVNVMVSKLTRPFTKESAGFYVCELTTQKFVLQEEIEIKLLEHVDDSSAREVYIWVLVPLILSGAIAFVIWIKMRPRHLSPEESFERFIKDHGHCAADGYPLAEQLPTDKKWAIPKDKLKVGKKLGSGQFGVVYEAEVVGLLRGELIAKVAVKSVRHNEEDYIVRCLVQEFKIMSNIGKHEYVLRLLGAFVDEEAFALVLEYCQLGCLLTYITDNKYRFINDLETSSVLGEDDSEYCRPLAGDEMPFNTSILVGWSYQIARGMEWLASRMVLHGDLALRNILLNTNNMVKISDFGLAKSLESNCENEYFKRRELKVPVRWMAPECFAEFKLSTETDVWSFGVTLWEIFSLGAVPYAGIPVVNLYQTLLGGYRMEQTQCAPNEIYAIMRHCWMQAPEQRPTFSQLTRSLSSLLGNDLRVLYLKMEVAEVGPTQDYSNMLALIGTGENREYVVVPQKSTRF